MARLINIIKEWYGDIAIYIPRHRDQYQGGVESGP